MECVNLGLVASDGLDNVCFNGTVVARLASGNIIQAMAGAKSD